MDEECLCSAIEVGLRVSLGGEFVRAGRFDCSEATQLVLRGCQFPLNGKEELSCCGGDCSFVVYFLFELQNGCAELVGFPLELVLDVLLGEAVRVDGGRKGSAFRGGGGAELS